MNSKDEALIIFKKLVENFRAHETEYIQDSYLEYSVRSEFIDKFFSALNWDVDNTKNLAPKECEVIRENHVSEGNNKRVDYTFNIGGGTKFLVEAKKPSEKLDSPSHIFQTKSYAFSKGTNLAVLTNFKDFRVYDIKVKPLFNQPEVDLVDDLTISYQDYEKTFDRLWRLFEYYNVARGSTEEFYMSNRKGMSQSEIENALKIYNQRGVTLLNKAFLEDLLGWREKLARSIHSLNKSLDVYSLNEIVQRYIDRIVFLRIIEDRRIEGEDILSKLCNEWYRLKSYSLKDKLEDTFTELNRKYNGMIFKEHDGIKNMQIDDLVIYDFIMSLYVPQSPYNFAIIDVDILGKIFEQYLGYIITIENGDLIVEYKDEEKKSSGVYYTRQEIVDKIIAETVVPVINKITTVEKLKEYKILDMSCGSGSFIIEAYRAIVNRYQEIFIQMIAEGKAVPEGSYFIEDKSLYLSMSFKKEVAINNIFGVDIDPQAIEISKMSIYILMLEMNYKDDTVRPILPTLEENLKTGNSIIMDDYYDDNVLDVYEDRIVNPFNYEKEFIKVFEQGGFDCIIGNPPYIKIQSLNKNYPKGVINYILKSYPGTANGNFDIYVVFVNRAMMLLKSTGRMGMILLNNFFTSDYGEGLRKYLSDNKYVNKIVNFGDIQVFDNSRVYTCLLYLQKQHNEEFLYHKVDDYEVWKADKEDTYISINSSLLTSKPWYFSDELYNYLEGSIFTKCQILNNVSKTFGGVQPTANDVYLVTLESEDDKYSYCYVKDEKEPIKFETESLRPVVKGSKDIRYYSHELGKRLIFPYDVENDKATLIEEDEYSKRFPETYKYLLKHKTFLNSKHKNKSNEKSWYRYEYVKNHALFEQQKILVPAMTYGSRFSFDVKGNMYITCGGASAGGGRVITLLPKCDNYDYYSLLGILNSCVITYLIIRNGIPKRGGWQGISKNFVEEIPIPIIRGDKNKIKILNKISQNAKNLCNLYEQPKAESQSENERINKRIKDFRIAIDESVCNLYEIENNQYKKIIEYLMHHH